MALAKGVLAGNLFDWGAKAVVEMLESDSLSFDVALSKLQGGSANAHCLSY